MSAELPLMYTELADWFHLLSAPAEYAEEADFYLNTLSAALGRTPDTLLELGAGAGNNAWHYKRRVPRVVLTELAPGMLALSERINPECEHHVADMRSLRLAERFDAVFVHDAISYLVSEGDLRAAFETAYAHLHPGGVALFAPDHTRENFRATTDCGGHDDATRGLRWLEWTFDPDPTDATYQAEYAFLLHEADHPSRVVRDLHTCGLFSRQTWLGLLREVGFGAARGLVFDHSELEPGSLEVFVGVRPAKPPPAPPESGPPSAAPSGR